MTRAMYPGSFDPVHVGHVDIVEIAAAAFDEVIVVTMYNPAKEGFFPLAQRRELLEATLGHLHNVSITSATGLVVDAASDLDATVIVKGIRSATDLDVELQMAQTNKAVSGVQTMFVPTEPDHSFVSSRFIREIASHGGDVSTLVPPVVAAALARKVSA
jgi:pantetheine-phosphate adenylyltransferase